MTDTILPKSIFGAANLGTLNAHPAGNPTYRGLGAFHRMLKDKITPVITVHFIYEGVDTRPIIHFEKVNQDVVECEEQVDVNINKYQARAFTNALAKLVDKSYTHDVFEISSGMGRYLSTKEQKEAVKFARQNWNELTSFDGLAAKNM